MATVKARDRVFDALAKAMYRIGLRPNHLTLLQVPVYAVMIWHGVHGHLVAFGMWQLLIMLLDGMDGTLARRMGVASRSGAVLDAVFDLFGIIVVVAVAAYIHPHYAVWLWVTLGVNLALYAQNGWLDEKAVSYVRGPVVIGMYVETLYPGIMWVSLLVPLVSASVILVVRGLFRPVPPAEHLPAPFHPGFSVEEGKVRPRHR